MTVKLETIMTMSCEGPLCAKSVQFISDVEESIPDKAWRYIIFQLMDNSKHTFCSELCLREWLRDYKELKSPRELKTEQERQLKLVPTPASGEVPETVQTEQASLDILAEMVRNGDA